MPILVKNLRNTRQDPRRRSARRPGRTVARRGKIMVGARCVKDGGKGITISEQTLLTNIVQIHRLFMSGVISLRALPRSTALEMKSIECITTQGVESIRAFYDEVVANPERLAEARRVGSMLDKVGGETAFFDRMDENPGVPPIDLLEKLAAGDDDAEVDSVGDPIGTLHSVAEVDATLEAAFVAAAVEATPEPVEEVVPAVEDEEPEPEAEVEPEPEAEVEPEVAATEAEVAKPKLKPKPKRRAPAQRRRPNKPKS